MKTVLVSGASGIIGYGILRSLKNTGLKLIGTSIYTDSVAQGFCDIFEQAIPTDDLSYLDWLLDIINKHHVDLIIAGIEVDTYKWNDEKDIIEQHTRILSNNTELISLSRDKLTFYENLLTANTPYSIETSISHDYDEIVNMFGSPFLLKRRCGFGSKGLVQVKSFDTFLDYEHIMGTSYMAQPIIGNNDEEYTTAAFGDGTGHSYCGITLKRKLSKEGFTDRAEVADIQEINEAVGILCKHFKPVGPTNFQFRISSGVPKLLEINPRISSSTSIRTAFGYNECLMSVEYYLNGKIPVQPEIKQGKAVRYMEDFIYGI